MSEPDFSEILKILPKDLACEIEENNQRKNYGILEIAEIQEILRKRLQQEFTPGRKPRVGNSENCQKLDTLRSFGITRIDELVGKMTGQSKETVRKNRIIYNAVQKKPELGNIIDKVDQGKASYTMLYKTAQRKSKPKPEPFPNGKFPNIYADPPWQYGLSQSGAAEDHYPTMSTEEICNLGSELPAAKNSVLLLWATIPNLDEAFTVIKAWSFEYKTAIVWEKEKNGQIQRNGIGYWVNSAAEMLLIAVKGKPELPETRFPGVVQAPRTKHSQKPEIFYDLIEKAFPNMARLELFARNSHPRKGWTYWGNESQNDKKI